MQKEIFAYMFPGMMIMWVFFIAQNALADIYNERARKTLMRLMASPVTVNHIVLSKFLYSFTLCLLVEFVLILMTSLVFGIHWGSPFWLLIVVIAINFALTGVLAFLYGLAKSKAAADSLTVIFILFIGFLGGGFFPFEEMPKFFQQIGAWSVNRWAFLGIQAVMQDKSLGDLLTQVYKMLLFGTVTMMAGTMLLKWRFEKGEGI